MRLAGGRQLCDLFRDSSQAILDIGDKHKVLVPVGTVRFIPKKGNNLGVGNALFMRVLFVAGHVSAQLNAYAAQPLVSRSSC